MSWDRRRVFVTGATGLVGSWLCRSLLDQGAHIVALVRDCRFVVAIHGCAGREQRVLLGGRDAVLKDAIATSLSEQSLAAVVDGHRYPALRPENICNRGAYGQGVQLEITHSLRRSMEAVTLAIAVRRVLLAVSAPESPAS